MHECTCNGAATLRTGVEPEQDRHLAAGRRARGRARQDDDRAARPREDQLSECALQSTLYALRSTLYAPRDLDRTHRTFARSSLSVYVHPSEFRVLPAHPLAPLPSHLALTLTLTPCVSTTHLNGHICHAVRSANH